MTNSPDLASPPENPEGEWLHDTVWDHSYSTGAVAACKTCGWGVHGDSASWAKRLAEKHREKYGLKEPELAPVEPVRVILDEPVDVPGKPGPKAKAKHGSTAMYHRGCRCDECRAAKAAYKKKRRAELGWRAA